MKRLRHSHETKPLACGTRQSGLIEGMRERRYRRIVKEIGAANMRLECLRGKRRTLEALAKIPPACVEKRGGRNRDETMSHARTCKSSLKSLKPEFHMAAFELFSQTMLKAALFGCSSLVLLHFSLPGTSPLVAGAIGALFIAGSLMRAWGQVASGSEEFLNLVSTLIDEQKASLEIRRKLLIRKLHGWDENQKNG